MTEHTNFPPIPPDPPAPADFLQIAAQADRFGQWDERLRLEIPFFSAILARHGARHVCDVGCGGGRHTLAFAQMNFHMTGIDPNKEYIGAARQRAKELGVSVEFSIGGFEDVAKHPAQPFDALLVLGNALALAESPEHLQRVIAAFSRALKKNGLLIIQVPNYHLFDDPAKRWKGPPSPGAAEPQLVLKHFAPWGKWHYALEFLTVRFDPATGWTYEIRRTELLALTAERLEASLGRGFKILEQYGHADGRAFAPGVPDCILVAQK